MEEKTVETTITEILNSTNINSVEKLVNLNNNSYLNSYLLNKNYKPISEVIIKRIEEDVEPEVNVNVLKFYLHEIGLIFNRNYNHLLKGVAYIG